MVERVLRDIDGNDLFADEGAPIQNYRPAEMMAYLPNVQRTTSHAIRFVAKDMVEASRFLEFVGTYEAGLTP